MRNFVRLTTTALQRDASIHHFQFGTVPAPPGSFAALATSVPQGSTATEIFSFEGDIEVPDGQNVRFDIRFEVDVHNSAMLQISLDGVSGGTDLAWRWAAPIGVMGDWSRSEQQAPWSDDSMDYSINIRGDGANIDVALSERPTPTTAHRFALIPPEPA